MEVEENATKVNGEIPIEVNGDKVEEEVDLKITENSTKDKVIYILKAGL